MLYTLLGIIIGLLLAIIAFLSVRRYQTPIERTFKNINNQLKEKGEVFVTDEKTEDLEAWFNNLPKE